MESYSYTKENLIEKPNTYFYSSFFGYDFFVSWKEQRKLIYDNLGGEMGAPASVFSCGIESIEGMINSELVPTDKLLEAIFGILDNSDEEPVIRLTSIIFKLIKKFEVSKRWHVSYLKGLRVIKESNDFWNLELYLRAAEIFEKTYIKLCSLPTLNVFLKSIDTLCSVAKALDENQKKRLARLIKNEALFIEQLGDKLNVKL